jgi:chemotaxis protein CheD
VPSSGPKIITLNPGELAFAEGDTILQTLLGSCVAVTFWDARWRIGAMCHYMLPVRPSARDTGHSGRYADEALCAIAQRFEAMSIHPSRLEVRMFGGGNMFAKVLSIRRRLIGDLNIEAGRYLLEDLGFKICEEDLAGEVRRKVVFELPTGRVTVEHGQTLGQSWGGAK